MTPPIESPLHSDDPTFPELLSLGRSIVRGTGWTVGARLTVQGIAVVSTLILARILIPADFGLVALASAFSGALQAISEFSFDVVLIQNQRAGRTEYDTAWTLSVCRNAIVALILLVSAHVIASSFGDPRLEPIVYWLALATAVDGAQNIGIVDFRKELAFDKDFAFMVVGKLGSFIVTVPLALILRSYWALVAGMVAGSMVRVLLSFAMHSYRPRISFAGWRDLLHFSKWLVFGNVCDFVFGRSSTFIIGKISGEQAIGIINLASEITGIVTGTFLSPLRRAMFPGYSKFSHDVGQLQASFVDVTAVMFLVGAPLTLGIGVVADPLVRVMLGEHWLGAIPLVQVLAVSQLFQLLTAGASPIFLATGRPQFTTVVQVGRVLVILPFLVFATERAGALGAAYCYLVVSILVAVCDFVLVKLVLRVPLSRLIRGWWRPTAAVVAMVWAVAEFEKHWPTSESMGSVTLMLIAAVALGAVIYLVFGICLWLLAGLPRGAETQLFTVMKMVVGNSYKTFTSFQRRQREKFGPH